MLQNQKLSLDMQGENISSLQKVLVYLQYSIDNLEIQKKYFGKTTKTTLEKFQRKSNLQVSGELDNATYSAIVQLFSTVEGTVRQKDGTVFIQGSVRVLDKDMRTTQPLGIEFGGSPTPIDCNGKYKVWYTTDQFIRADKGRADLIVQVLDLTGNILVESSTLYQASQNTIMPDLVIGGGTYKGPSEFEMLVATLSPITKRILFHELTDKDIEFLVYETETKAQHIQFLIWATQSEIKTGIPAACFYGMARENLPTSLADLLRLDSSLWQKTLESAIESNTIPLQFKFQLEEILKLLNHWADQYTLTADPESNTNLSDLLTTMNLDQVRQVTLAQRIRSYSGAPDKFWESQLDWLNQKTIDRIQLTQQFGLTTQYYIPLINSLQKDSNIQTVKDLSKFSASHWTTVVTSLAEKSKLPGDMPVQQYVDQLMQSIEAIDPTAFVAARLQEEDDPHKKGLVDFLNNHPQFDLLTTPIDTYLNAHKITLPAPHLEQLKTYQRVRKITPTHQAANMLIKDGKHSAYSIIGMGENKFLKKYSVSLGNEETAKRTYRKAQKTHDSAIQLIINYKEALRPMRLFAIDGPSPLADKDANLTTLLGSVDEVANLTTLFGSMDLCECSECSSVYSPTAYLVDILQFLRDRELIKSSDLNKPEHRQDRPFAKDLLFKRRPDLGNLELSCENANTPLPYIDLVNEILEQAIAPVKSINISWITELKSSLKTLNQTSIQIPQFVIDELAKQDIILSPQATISSVEGKAEWLLLDDTRAFKLVQEGSSLNISLSLQTRDQADVLEARPSYLNPLAYQKLTASKWPLTLPFDLNLEESRAYLQQLGVSRYTLTKSLSNLSKDPAAPVAVAVEYLNFNSVDHKIIIDSSPSEPWELWGLQKNNNQIYDLEDHTIGLVIEFWPEFFRGSDKTLPASIRVLLQRSQLSFDELTQILNTEFVNPSKAVRIKSIKKGVTVDPDYVTCDLSQLYLSFPLIRGRLFSFPTRLARFIRLWRQLGWKVYELDQVIMALGEEITDLPREEIIDLPRGEITDLLLRQIAQLQQLAKMWRLPILALLNLWAPINTYLEGDELSLYDSLFQNKTVLNPVDSAFKLDVSREELEQTNQKLTDHTQTLLAAFNITQDELQSLINHLGIDELNLINLSALYRHVWLSAALKLSIDEFLALKALTTIDIFNQTEPENISLLLNQLQLMRAAHVTIEQLNDLLRNKGSDIADKDIGITLHEIRSGLQKIKAEYNSPDSVEITKQKLATLQPLAGWQVEDVDHAIELLSGAYKHKTSLPLSSLPIGGFPSELQDKISYQDGHLQFVGAMTLDEQTLLTSLSSDTIFQHAISNLFFQPRQFVREKFAILFSGVQVAIDKANAALFDRSSTMKEDRFNYILLHLTSYLRKVKADYNSLDPTGEITKQKFSILQPLAGWQVEDVDHSMGLLLGTYRYKTPLPNFSLPPIAIPDPNWDPDLKGKVSYDSAAKKIRFLGVMSLKERDALLALSSNEDYQSAINTLYSNAPQTSQDNSALLETLPLLDFPNKLENKLSYQDGYLQFIGPMSADVGLGTFSEKAGLDVSFSNAVNNLFYQPRQFMQEKFAIFLAFLGTETDIFYQASETLFNSSSTTKEDRFNYILPPLTTYLRKTLSQNFVLNKLSSALQVDTAIGKIFLENKLFDAFLALSDLTREAGKELFPLERDESSEIEKAFEQYTLLQKMALVINTFKLTSDEFEWWLKKGASFGLDLMKLPVRENDPALTLEAWENLACIFQLRALLPSGEPTLFAILDDILAKDQSNFIDKLSEKASWTKEDLNTLLDPALIVFPNEYHGKLLMKLYSCMGMLRYLGIPAVQALSWIRNDLSPEKAFAQARDIKQTLKAQYEDEKQWLEVNKKLQNVIREKKRSALVAYLIADPFKVDNKAQWYDTNGLYGYFLIDVEMSSCQVTSRTQQAISTAQLFIQRCLIQLEEYVPDSVDEKWQEWNSWRKNYSIWGANRKVFLYPENWIEPNLRLEKSPFFKDVENELMQDNVTAEVAERVYINYLEKLKEISQLEICAMYHQEEPEENGQKQVDIVHVFGRTASDPKVYYHRQWIDKKKWTPWEKIDADIVGDHLIPVFWNRRLYLFWPIFTLKAERTQETFQEGMSLGSKKYWFIQLAWCEYKNQKWSSKKVSSNSVQSGRPKNEDQNSEENKQSQREYAFRTLVFQKELHISYRTLNYTSIFPLFGVFLGHTFCFVDSDQEPIIKEAKYENYFSTLFCPNGTNGKSMAFDGSGGSPLYLPHQQKQALGKTPNNKNFRLNFCYQPFNLNKLGFPIDEAYSLVDMRDPILFQDANRTFFIQPRRRDILRPRGSTEEFFPFAFHFKSFYHPYSTLFSQLLNRLGVEGLLQRKVQIAPSSFSQNLEHIVRDYLVDLGWNQVRDLMNKAMRIIDGTSPLPAEEQEDCISQHFSTFLNPTEAQLHLVREGKDQEGKNLPPKLVDKLERFEYVKSSLEFYSLYRPSYVSRPYPDTAMDFSLEGAYSLYNWELFFHIPLLIADRLSQNQQFEAAQKWFHFIFDPTSVDAYPTPQRYWKTKPFFDTTKEGTRKQQIQNILNMEMNPEFEQQVSEWQAHPFDPHLVARMRTVAYQKTVVMKYIDNLVAWGDHLFSQNTRESINQATMLYVFASMILGPKPPKVAARAKPATYTYNTLGKLDPFSNTEVENLILDPAPSNSTASSTPIDMGQMLYFCIPQNDQLLGYWDTVSDRLFKIRHCMNMEGIVQQLPLFEPIMDPALLVQAVAAGMDLTTALNDLNAPLPHYRFTIILQKALELCAEVKSLGASMLSALEKQDAEDLSLIRSGHEVKLLNAIKAIKQKAVEEAEFNWKAVQDSKKIAEARSLFYGSRPLRNVEEEVAFGINIGRTALKTLQAIGFALAAGASYVPDNKLGAPTTIGATFGGGLISSGQERWALTVRTGESALELAAGLASEMGRCQWRQDENMHQRDSAQLEMAQIDQQISAASKRRDIAIQDQQNHDLQMDQADQVYQHLRNKYTNKELYQWLARKVSTLYSTSYQLAYSLAKQAEKAYRYELGLSESNFIKFGYWDSLKKGLMAGESLFYDLKRMEKEYLDRNAREYEMTKHISLALLDPMSLISLKQTGSCFITLPESLFDTDHPGHYMRRIKNVSLTIPCVVGPYTSVNCRLTLFKHTIRKNSQVGDTYARNGIDDSRFEDKFGATQSIVTSHGQNDSGLFEVNFRDERRLPFEWAGAISEWRLELPPECNQFDFNTISDVILHMRYTAKEGGDTLRVPALAKLADLPLPTVALFSARYNFSNEWHRFLYPDNGGNQDLAISLTRDRFPFRVRQKDITVKKMQFFLRLKSGSGLGDIPTKLSLKPPSYKDPKGPILGAWQANASLEDMPYASFIIKGDENVDDQTNTWLLKVLNNQKPNISADIVEDLFIVCVYELKDKQ
jgi:hypothetical protein